MIYIVFKLFCGNLCDRPTRYAFQIVIPKNPMLVILFFICTLYNVQFIFLFNSKFTYNYIFQNTIEYT